MTLESPRIEESLRFARDRTRPNLLVQAPWVPQPDDACYEAFFDLTAREYVRLETGPGSVVRELTEAGECEAAAVRYEVWVRELGVDPAEVVAAAQRSWRQRMELMEASRAAHAAQKARRLADEARARAREAAASHLAAAAARHRDADAHAGALSLHVFEREDATALTVLRVGAAEGAGTPFGFDVEAGALVPLIEGTLGPALVAPAALADALERFAAWQARERARHAARRRRAALDRFAEQLRACGRELSATPLPIRTREAALGVDAVDLRLAIEWCKPPHDAELRALYQEVSGPVEFARALDADPGRWSRAAFELGRTLSARVAEKAARWFYRDRLKAQAVDDVSYRQGRELLDPCGAAADPDWRTHDLVVHHPGRVSVDVKNARPRSRKAGPAGSRPHYVEHCVRRFKKDAEHRDVLIAGVLSPPLTASQLLGADYRLGDTPLFLGHTVRKRIERLQGEFSRGTVRVSLTSGIRRRDRLFVPPWLYEYPRRMYDGRDQALRTVAKLAADAPELLAAPRDLWGLFLAAGVMRPDAPAVQALERPWQSFVRGVAALPESRRRSLPVLYLSVLRHFLETVADVARRAGGGGGRLCESFQPGRYAEFLFLPGGAPDWPLGVYDPLCTVDSLIASLSIVAATRPEVLLRFRHFRFKQTGVLTGRADGAERSVTIMYPYCGGRGCRRENLVLGADGAESCEHCGLLICPNPWCRFCCDGCGERRRERIKAARPASIRPTRAAPACAAATDDLPFG